MPRTREQLQKALTDTEAWLDQLDPETVASPEAETEDLRAIGQALHAVAASDLRLADEVAKARTNGRTWTQIGAVLGVSKQAARERFGEPAALVVSDTYMGDTSSMAEPNRRIVKPNHDGGWDVAARDAQRASAHYDKQSDAIDRARQILGNLGGGELEIRGRDGAVRKQDTVPHGNDPQSSKG